MKHKIVVIGIGFASRLATIRAVAETGAEISVIAIGKIKAKPVDCYSKYVSHFYYCHGNDEHRLMKILLNDCVDPQQKTILIPINDFAASVIDRNMDLLNKHYLFPHIRHQQGAITEWMNKEKQKEVASASGLSIVRSIDIELKDGFYQMPDGINYPCFTKTREFTAGYKNTLHRCNNEKDLRKVLDRLSTRHKLITIMVEDYKEIEKEYAVVGVSNGKEVIIPGVIEILMMAKGSVKGVACKGKIMPTDGFEDLIDRFKDFILRIDFVGLFDIDFYLSEGKYYFGELNLRIGGSANAVLKMGVNLPAMFIKFIQGEDIDGMVREIKSTATFVNEKICSDHWYEGYMSTRNFHDILHTSDISFVEDKEDPMPQKYFIKSLPKLRLIRAIKKYPRIIKRYLLKSHYHIFSPCMFIFRNLWVNWTV